MWNSLCCLNQKPVKEEKKKHSFRKNGIRPQRFSRTKIHRRSFGILRNEKRNQRNKIVIKIYAALSMANNYFNLMTLNRGNMRYVLITVPMQWLVYAPFRPWNLWKLFKKMSMLGNVTSHQHEKWDKENRFIAIGVSLLHDIFHEFNFSLVLVPRREITWQQNSTSNEMFYIIIYMKSNYIFSHYHEYEWTECVDDVKRMLKVQINIGYLLCFKCSMFIVRSVVKWI